MCLSRGFRVLDRPLSQFSTASPSYNSREGRLSLVSILEDGSTITQMIPQQMPHINEHAHNNHRSSNNGAVKQVSGSRFAKLKYYYDHSFIRHIAPFLVLALYSVIGAYLFYLVEYQNEKDVLLREQEVLDDIRNDTFYQIKRIIFVDKYNDDTKILFARDILKWYEKQLAIYKSPEALEWDYLGALFYVGTVFTTIGYGNITPRTIGGQALSILYAIVGIPLVLAILNQFSKKLTRFVSDLWIKHRESVRFEKLKELKARKLSRSKAKNSTTNTSISSTARILIDHDLESGKKKKDKKIKIESAEAEQCLEAMESRTIPIWVALALCVGYICLIAALFCIWETRWSYFTSFYFICISCLTIGLGDVVPDHPHMLILMFIFVILGLSIVSMLMSVIQIKMEEWLYRMMIKMQKEYRRALENGDPLEREQIMNQMMKNEPWYMRNLASICISDNQAAKLDHEAETFEKVLRVTNNKNVQTESPIAQPPKIQAVAESQTQSPLLTATHAIEVQTNAVQQQDTGIGVVSEWAPNPAVSKQTSVSSSSLRMVSAMDKMAVEHASRSEHLEDEVPLQASALLHSNDGDSVSDATSLPMDPINSLMTLDQSVQCANLTQMDDLATRLHEINKSSKPEVVDNGTEMVEVRNMEDKCMRTDTTSFESKEIQVMLKLEFESKSVGTEPKDFANQSTTTSYSELTNRSMETMDGSLWRGECSRSVQTMFPESEYDGALLSPDATSKRRRFSHSKKMISFEDTPLTEMSVQCSLQQCDTCDFGVQTMLSTTNFDFQDTMLGPSFTSLLLPGYNEQDKQTSRQSSLVGTIGEDDDLGEEVDLPKPVTVKQDLIIQTDDSYLKIARRLDEYRNNRTQTLQVYATPFTLSSRSASSSRSPTVIIEEPSLFRSVDYDHGQSPLQGFLEPAAEMLRASFKRRKGQSSRKKDQLETEDVGDKHLSAQEKLEKSRSISPNVKKNSLERKHSLPASVQPGKVLSYIAKHEKGINNPGAPEGHQSLVTVVDMRKDKSVDMKNS
uniref:Potassium channel domain-containing protein n=1 Tax=Ditylenchus dipsaci TaxID=166011 RepID=A0A915CR07_9BILA